MIIKEHGQPICDVPKDVYKELFPSKKGITYLCILEGYLENDKFHGFNSACGLEYAVYNELKPVYEDKINFVMKTPKTALVQIFKLSERDIPTVMIVKNKEIIHRFCGATGKSDIEAALRGMLCD